MVIPRQWRAARKAPRILTLTATPISTTQINLSWTAEPGNVGLAGFKVYVNGVLYLSLADPNASSCPVTGLAQATVYRFSVAPYDVNGIEYAADPVVLQATAVPANGAGYTATTVAPTAVARGFALGTGAGVSVTPTAPAGSAASTGGASAAPYIVGIDIPEAPTANLATGSENDKGWYLTIIGKNLGSPSDWGVTNHVLIGGVEVDNYRCLVDCVGTVTQEWGIRRLTVQLGALGNPTAGVALPIVVTVGGVVASNPTNGGGFMLDEDGEVISFTPVVGICKFVSQSGNDAAAGGFTAPLRRLQSTDGLSGAFRIGTGANTTSATPPSTFVCARSSPGVPWTDTGRLSRGIDLFRITGLPGRPIHLTSYPGPSIAVNQPERFLWQGQAGVGGFINGNDSTRADEPSTAYGGFTGYCQDLRFSNLEGISSPSGGSDAGPWNLQNSMRRPRMVNCLGSWPGPATGARQSAGIEGSPIDGRFIACEMSDIAGTSAEECHGVYLDGYNGNFAPGRATGNILKYIVIRGITGGSGLNHFDGVNVSGLLDNKMHHFVMDGVSKHALNLGQGTKGFVAHDFIVRNIEEDAVRTNTTSVTATNGIYLYNFVVYNFGTVQPNRYFVEDNATVGSGTARIENGIVMQPASHPATSYGWLALNSPGKFTFAAMQYYDASGRLTTAPNGTYGNPQFANAGANDFSLASGSPCIDTGNTPLLPRLRDYACVAAPVGAAHDKGAYER